MVSYGAELVRTSGDVKVIHAVRHWTHFAVPGDVIRHLTDPVWAEVEHRSFCKQALVAPKLHICARTPARFPPTGSLDVVQL